MVDHKKIMKNKLEDKILLRTTIAQQEKIIESIQNRCVKKFKFLTSLEWWYLKEMPQNWFICRTKIQKMFF